MGTIARQSVSITVLTAAGLALGFVNMAILYPRFLSPEEFGLTRLLVSISVLTAQVAQLGLESTVIRYFPYFKGRSHRHGGLFSLALLVASISAAVAMLVLALFHPWFSVWFNDPIGLYHRFGLIVLPMTLAEIYFILMRGFSRSIGRSVAPIFTREFLLRVLQTALIGGHVLWSWSFTTFIWGYAATFALTTLLLLLDLWRSGGIRFERVDMRIPKRMSRSMVRYAAFTMVTGIAGVAAGNVDQLMLAAMLKDGLSYVAYYAVAMFMASIIMVPARALVMPLLPVIAEAWRRREMGRLQEIFHWSTRVPFLLGVYVLLCLAVCVDPLFTYLEPGYEWGKPALIILGVTNVVALLSGLSAGIISTSRSYALDAVTGAGHFVLNLFLDFVLVKWLGALGVAWSSLIAMLLVVSWRILFLGMRYGLWPFEAKGLARMVVPIGCAALTWWVPATSSPFIDILLRCTAITLLFWPIAYTLRLVPEGMMVWRTITSRVNAIADRGASKGDPSSGR